MTKEGYDVEKELRKWFSNAARVVIAGIGNPIRMDDYVGVKIIQNLRGEVSENVDLIECETVPEGCIQQIVDFDATHVLLIDAAILGLKPGKARLIKPEKLTTYSAVSTHMLPLRIFCDCLKGMTKAKIALLLIEPKETGFGEKLTFEIQTAAKNITNILFSILP